jgi:hypothetical protein
VLNDGRLDCRNRRIPRGNQVVHIDVARGVSLMTLFTTSRVRPFERIIRFSFSSIE